MLSIILTGAALIREREHGTIEHLLVMPVTPFEIMVSKIWSMGLVVLVGRPCRSCSSCRDCSAVPIEGSIPLFLFGTALYLFATTMHGHLPGDGCGLHAAVRPADDARADAAANVVGATTPRESMPEIIQDIMLAAPNTHFVILAQAMLFRGAGLDVVWPQFAALLVIGAILFFFSLQRFREFLR